MLKIDGHQNPKATPHLRIIRVNTAIFGPLKLVFRGLGLALGYDARFVSFSTIGGTRIPTQPKVVPRKYTFFFFFFILRRMGKNKALAHHTSTYFHTRRVSI